MLTARQKRFADEYLLGGDPEQAYRKAGYREKNAAAGARRLLALPTVQDYLSGCEARSFEKPVADANEVLQFLTAVLRGESGSEKERFRAAELLGKRHGIFNEKTVADAASVVIVDDLDG